MELINDIKFTIHPLGDSALVINFGNVIDEAINKNVLLIFKTLKNIFLPEIIDIVPAYSSLAVYYDVLAIRKRNNTNTSAFEIFSEEIKNIIQENKAIPLSPPRNVKIPACYSEKYALDIKDIAQQKNLSHEEIIRLHTSKTYRVYMIGFLPGFPYMGEVDERIAIPRKSEPRTIVEAGSIGIAGKQTGIYPLDSPGGWQIIGKTPLKLFNKEEDDPVIFKPGDEVEFYSISEDEFTNY